MAANPLLPFQAQAEILAQVEVHEGAHLDREIDVPDRGADIFLVAFALELDQRAEVDDAVAPQQADADAVVRSAEGDRIAFATAEAGEERADLIIVGAGIGGQYLCAGPDD
jgi:hypothetical protein